jgi:hypothetical protein
MLSLAASAALVGCGSGASGAGGYRDLGSLTSALEAPTGTVDATSATGVAAAFEESQGSGLAGFRQKAQAQSASQACTDGGSVSASVNETAVYMTFSNCGESGCTMNGSGTIFLQDSGELTQCMSYDLSAVCADEGNVQLSFSGCLGADYQFVYLVEYEGETFKVSGNYAGGSGELTITGENGTYTCTYSGGSGSCTGDGQFSF